MNSSPRNRMSQEAIEEARAYAADFHAVFCEACHGIYQAQHGLPNDGHDCPANRSLPAQVQALREQLTVIEEARDSQDFEEALTEVERLVTELRAYHA